MARVRGRDYSSQEGESSHIMTRNHGEAAHLSQQQQQQLCVQRRTPMKRLPRRDYVTFKGIHDTAHVDAAADTSTIIRPTSKSSKYRGVTRHRSTGRYEAHLWDKSAFSVKQKKKGRQVYLGAYDDEIAAAQAYDLAALKHWGLTATINFQLENYTHQIEEMGTISKQEYLASLRRKSSGFSRGVSKFRGVAQHHNNGRWEARIGRVKNNKYLYLGTFATQEEAARAYDEAAIKHRGVNAVTNFALSRYTNDKPSEEGPEKEVTRIRPKRNVLKSQEHHVGNSSSVVVEENSMDHPQASSRSDSRDSDSQDLPEVEAYDDAEKTDNLGVLENNSALYAEMSEMTNFLSSRHGSMVPDDAFQLEDYDWDDFDIPPMDDKLLRD